jgi:hypothetical protein
MALSHRCGHVLVAAHSILDASTKPAGPAPATDTTYPPSRPDAKPRPCFAAEPSGPDQPPAGAATTGSTWGQFPLAGAVGTRIRRSRSGVACTRACPDIAAPSSHRACRASSPARRRVPSCGTARNGVITTAAGSRAHMFKHRRVRVTCVLLISWITLAAVERWAEQSPWPTATMNGLLWSCVVAGTWWFAEITQRRPPAATARETGKSAPSSEPKETAVPAHSSLSPAESSETTMDR